MTKSQIKSIQKVIEHSEQAHANGGGYYLPSDAQQQALLQLAAEISHSPENKDYALIAQYIMDIQNAEDNRVYTVCATLKQIGALKRQVATVNGKSADDNSQKATGRE